MHPCSTQSAVARPSKILFRKGSCARLLRQRSLAPQPHCATKQPVEHWSEAPHSPGRADRIVELAYDQHRCSTAVRNRQSPLQKYHVFHMPPCINSNRCKRSFPCLDDDATGVRHVQGWYEHRHVVGHEHRVGFVISCIWPELAQMHHALPPKPPFNFKEIASMIFTFAFLSVEYCQMRLARAA